MDVLLYFGYFWALMDEWFIESVELFRYTVIIKRGPVLEDVRLRKLKLIDSSRIYVNILISSVISIVITLLISAPILYVNFEQIAMGQVFRSNVSSLMQTNQEVRKMTEHAKSLSFQIYQDFTISSLLFYSKPDIFEVTLAMEQLNNYRRSMPFIESIYVYNAKNEDFYISSNNVRDGRQSMKDIDDQGIRGILDQFKNYLPYQPIPRTYSIGRTEPSEVSSYTYLGYDVINDNKLLNYAVVVNISESWISQDMNNSEKSSENITFIINQDGKLNSKYGNNPIMTDISDQLYIQKILHNAQAASSFVDVIDGTKSLITYTAPDQLGWRYVRITPYDSITQDILKMKQHTVYISLAILVLGLLISIFTSRKLHDPILKVIHKNKMLESERRNSFQIMRQHFLKDMVLGRETYNLVNLQNKLVDYGSSIDMQGEFMLVLFKIDEYQRFAEKYKDDAKLLRYAMLNIISEIGAESFRSEAIEMKEASLLVLLNFDRGAIEAEREALIDMLIRMQLAIKAHLKLSVSATVSPGVESIEQFVPVYKQVSEASLHRLFKGHGSILFAEDVLLMKTKEYEFPVHKEKQLVDCLMMGKINEAKKSYAEIVNETADYSYTASQLAISHLAVTINNVIHTLTKNNAFMDQPVLDTTIALLEGVETIEEIHLKFNLLFEEIGRSMEGKRNTKQEDLVHKINHIIERNYSNMNLSLNWIADELNMSPMYLSRLYKQMTLHTLTDVINEVRMSKAKHLLLQSNHSIADIAEQVGFTNSSYFYRMFKRDTGVTPSEFRKNALKHDV
ncbi:HTH-type transcriptional regulator YesS [compost metagenome]